MRNPRQTLMDAYLAEPIKALGFQNLVVSRGDYYRLLIEAGYDAKDAGCYAFGWATPADRLADDHDVATIRHHLMETMS